jgi:CRISPR-associated endonuclease/helicase Cas3
MTFAASFEALTGYSPFPWQARLYERFMSDRGDNIPSSCNLPTGMGKTSVIAVWLIALHHGAKVPRRLVYVVNRRTVVDQTTEEVEKYKSRLEEAGIANELAVSTLRGQFVDNGQWYADPSQPAVICGTVDMIGSRLLFSGYGVGFKAKPLHAGFLGQDSLLIHDEAHLEPAFQRLIEEIEKEQKRRKDRKPMRVMELTATSRGEGEVFTLTDDDHQNADVSRRFRAAKKLQLHPLKDQKKPADELAACALAFKDGRCAVLIFARTVDVVMKIRSKLPADRALTLTGTMRGKERDELVNDPIFRRFVIGKPTEQETVYLICTAAGEVGVNLSADHLICDLTPFDSMAQRWGRVNRFGNSDNSEIHVFHPTLAESKDDKFSQACQKTLELIDSLHGDASLASLSRIDSDDRAKAFTPEPVILPVTDILFDAWSLTTIREPLPGRPPVDPYLHGIADWQPDEVQVAWRTEVERITGDLLNEYPPEVLLDEYPLEPRELLKEPIDRAFGHFQDMAKRLEGQPVPVWILDSNGSVEVINLDDLVDKRRKDRLADKTVIFPPSAGGLNKDGMLDGKVAATGEVSLDVADTDKRRRVENEETIPPKMHIMLTIWLPDKTNSPGVDDEEAKRTPWHWCKFRNEGDRSAAKPVFWDVHVSDVEKRTQGILGHLDLTESLKQAVLTAAAFHDHGKKRLIFQRMLGNDDPNVWLAKSGKKARQIKDTYRHEFGSLLDVDELVTGEHRDLILHLIAAHHGRARPHFTLEEAFDRERDVAKIEEMAIEVPQRFARLQRQYGRWGLAYLESLLRVADWSASENPSSYVENK